MKKENQNPKQLKRERNKRYREKHRFFRVVFDKKTAKQIAERASGLNLTAPAYLRQLAHSDIYGTGYITPNPEAIQKLQLSLAQIGGNINQLVRYCHTRSELRYREIRTIQQEIKRMEALITNAMTLPPKIEDILWLHLLNHSNHPNHPNHLEKAQRLQALITQFIKQRDISNT